MRIEHYHAGTVTTPCNHYKPSNARNLKLNLKYQKLKRRKCHVFRQCLLILIFFELTNFNQWMDVMYVCVKRC